MSHSIGILSKGKYDSLLNVVFCNLTILTQLFIKSEQSFLLKLKMISKILILHLAKGYSPLCQKSLDKLGISLAIIFIEVIIYEFCSLLNGLSVKLWICIIGNKSNTSKGLSLFSVGIKLLILLGLKSSAFALSYLNSKPYLFLGFKYGSVRIDIGISCISKSLLVLQKILQKRSLEIAGVLMICLRV